MLKTMVRFALPLAACALVLGFGPVLASDRGQNSIGDTSVFATLPRPGHPFGIAVDTDRVYVSTSRGDFFAQQTNSEGERVFAFDKEGELQQTTSIATMPVGRRPGRQPAADAQAVRRGHERPRAQTRPQQAA